MKGSPVGIITVSILDITLSPVDVSGLRCKPVKVTVRSLSDLGLGLYLPQYKATNAIPAPMMMKRGWRAVWCLRDFKVVPCIAVKGLLLA